MKQKMSNARPSTNKISHDVTTLHQMAINNRQMLGIPNGQLNSHLQSNGISISAANLNPQNFQQYQQLQMQGGAQSQAGKGNNMARHMGSKSQIRKWRERHDGANHVAWYATRLKVIDFHLFVIIAFVYWIES